MRPHPRLINLYDKPLHPRPSPRPRLRSGQASDTDWGIAALACFFITALAAGFFLIYGAMAHPQGYDLPTMAKPQLESGTRMVQPAPAPDMTSAAVVRANADVPEEYRLTAAPSAQQQAESRVSTAEMKPKKKPIVRPVKSLSPEAAQAYAAAPQAYAAAPGFDRVSAFGGF